MDGFQQNIRQRVSLDTQLKELNEKTKEIRNKRNELTDNIIEFVDNNNLSSSTIKISDGKLKFAQNKQTAPITLGFLEGCLSFPGFFGRVKRWLSIRAIWQEVKGDKLVKKEESLSGFEAVVWQHERDHLDGVMFVDRVKKDKGKFFKWENGQMIKTKVANLLKQEKTN